MQRNVSAQSVRLEQFLLQAATFQNQSPSTPNVSPEFSGHWTLNLQMQDIIQQLIGCKATAATSGTLQVGGTKMSIKTGTATAKKPCAYLQAEDDLKNIVKLVGPEALPDKQRLILETARIIRIAFLQQNALDPVDTYCSPQKQFKMLKIIVDFHRLADNVVSKGAPIFKVTELPITEEIMRMKTSIPNDKIDALR